MKTLLAVIGWDGICKCCTELLVFLQQICKSIFTYNSELVCRLHVTVIAVFRRSVYSYKTDGSNFTPVIKINRNETLTTTTTSLSISYRHARAQPEADAFSVGLVCTLTQSGFLNRLFKIPT